MTQADRILKRTQENLMQMHRIPIGEATPQQLHEALGQAVMGDIAPEWRATEQRRLKGRQACYLSAEYLIGRQVYNNLNSLGILEEVDRAFSAQGVPLAMMEEIEDAALGNGGLGRLAACYLDSAAAMDIPLTGYGLRYRFGLFKQEIENTRQKELPDDWTKDGDPWSVRRDELSVTVPFKGYSVKAVPYDMPVIGYRNHVVGTLRLWQTESLKELDLVQFNREKYAQASKDKNRAEDIVKVLYPSDDGRQGKLMRIRQQYVLSSASMQDMLRAYKAQNGSADGFEKRYAVQLNDTHPVMAIPELMRLLREEGFSMEQAFRTAGQAFNYTNHTVMREALEVWDLSLLNAAAPQLIPIIHWIDRRLQGEGVGLSVIRDKRVHMAELAVYVCKNVNGVAEIHSEILKKDVFREWYAVFPEKFKNVTNGVTQRRWLALCNPELTALIQNTLGSDRFLTDLNQLEGLRDQIDDELIREFISVKQEKKRQLARYIQKTEGVDLNEDFMFDIQIKRLHEYKRQLMNALCVLAMYREMKAGRLQNFPPTAALFGAKAAPGYKRAKAVISIINQLAERINADLDMQDRLKVVFVRNYNCSLAEKMIPAADLSQQISPAGTEASGTGNMKLMLNGAVTLGTLDGANIEIVRQAGDENNFIFGAKVDQLAKIRDSYDPRKIYDGDPMIRDVVDALDDGTFSDPEGDIAELKTALLDGASWHAPDHYYLLGDFRAYYEARIRAGERWLDRKAFAKMALLNIAGAGKFSSDRSVAEYAENIWNLNLEEDV